MSYPKRKKFWARIYQVFEDWVIQLSDTTTNMERINIAQLIIPF